MVHKFVIPLFIDCNTRQLPNEMSKHPKIVTPNVQTYMKNPRIWKPIEKPKLFMLLLLPHPTKTNEGKLKFNAKSCMFIVELIFSLPLCEKSDLKLETQQ